MRKQCLFDPNHLIEELGYTKHLLNCQSKLKKDWRKCKYADSHWYLYNYIEFHEKFECPLNPLFIEDPKQFQLRRQQEIRRRQAEMKSKKMSKTNSILSELKQEFQNQSSYASFSGKQLPQMINFGEISMIESQQKSKIEPALLSVNQNIQNHSILELHKVLDFDDGIKLGNTSLISNKHDDISRKDDNMISSKQQQMFEKGIEKKQKQLWTQPDFLQFEKKFRQKWLANKQKEIYKNQKQEQLKEDSFEEQEQHEITIRNVQEKYDQIDQI